MHSIEAQTWRHTWLLCSFILTFPLKFYELCSAFQPLAYREQYIQCAQDCMSVSNSSRSRTEHQSQSEAQSQEASPQQVTQSCEVGDGEVVWIQTPSPQPVHHQAGHVEQNHHLDNDNS